MIPLIGVTRLYKFKFFAIELLSNNSLIDKACGIIISIKFRLNCICRIQLCLKFQKPKRIQLCVCGSLDFVLFFSRFLISYSSNGFDSHYVILSSILDFVLFLFLVEMSILIGPKLSIYLVVSQFSDSHLPIFFSSLLLVDFVLLQNK